MLQILLYGLSTLFIIYIFLDLTWRLWTRKYSFLPSAPNVPWLGTAPYLGFSSRGFYKAVTAFAYKYDHLYVLWLGPLPVIRAGCVEYIEAVLRGQGTLTKSTLYEITYDWLGFGLLNSTGKKWKKRRMSLTPAFHFSILNDFSATFITHAQRFIEKLQTISNTGKPIDIQSLATLSTLDVICETSMGVQINALDSKDSEYVEALRQIKEQMVKRLINPFLKIKFVYKLTSDGKAFYRNLNLMHNFTISVINKRIADRKDISVGVDAGNETRVRKNTILLDVLIDLYEKGEIDIEGIREEVDTFMFEGHDTTSAGLSWTLYNIGCRPEIQQKILDEIDSVSLNQSSLTDKIRMLKYLDCVIKESQRIHPPVPMYGRILESDLKIGDTIIPAGTDLIVESFSVHMNEKYWDEPSIFKPERFESEEFLKRNPYCYIPFSAGPRNCIGQKFALLELKIYLYHILSRFKIKSVQTADQLELCYDLVTYSANGINIEFYSR